MKEESPSSFQQRQNNVHTTSFVLQVRGMYVQVRQYVWVGTVGYRSLALLENLDVHHLAELSAVEQPIMKPLVHTVHETVLVRRGSAAVSDRPHGRVQLQGDEVSLAKTRMGREI